MSLEKDMEDSRHVSDMFQTLNSFETPTAETAPQTTSVEEDFDPRAISRKVASATFLDERVSVQNVIEDVPVLDERVSFPKSEPAPEVEIQAAVIQRSVIDDEPAPVEVAQITPASSIDVINIKTKRTKKLDLSKFEKQIKATRPGGYPVVTMYSAYKAKMLPINLANKEVLMSDHQTLADRYTEIAKIIYNNIEEMSITKPSFSNWLKITALTDLETLLFGLFASTYPKESEVTIGCENRKCEKDIKLAVKPEHFIRIYEDASFNRIDEINAKVHNAKELVELNNVFNVTRKAFGTNQEIIVDLRECVSLYDYIEVLKAFTNSELQQMSSTILMLSILDKIYIKDATDGEYTEVDSVRDMFDVLTSTIFLPDWADDIYKFNESKAEPYSIEFKLPKTTCPHCATLQNERAVNVENLLFFKLRGKM